MVLFVLQRNSKDPTRRSLLQNYSQENDLYTVTVSCQILRKYVHCYKRNPVTVYPVCGKMIKLTWTSKITKLVGKTHTSSILCDYSQWAGSLSELFARVTWRRIRNLRASEGRIKYGDEWGFARRLPNRGSATKLLARMTHSVRDCSQDSNRLLLETFSVFGMNGVVFCLSSSR